MSRDLPIPDVLEKDEGHALVHVMTLPRYWSQRVYVHILRYVSSDAGHTDRCDSHKSVTTPTMLSTWCGCVSKLGLRPPPPLARDECSEPIILRTSEEGLGVCSSMQRTRATFRGKVATQKLKT